MMGLSRFAAIGLCLVVVFTAAPGLADVKWADAPHDDIFKSAKEGNKHVFIDFYTVWCGPCKKLDAVTYKDEKVIAFLNDMIPVKYDAEKGEGETLAKEYKIGSFPTLILLSPDGKEIDRHLGYLDPDEFVKKMSDYQNGIGTVAYYEKKVKEDPKDAEAWKTLGMKYADASRPDEAKTALNTYLELSPDATGDEKAEALYTIGDANYRAKSYDTAFKIYDGMTEEFAGTEWGDRAQMMTAYTLYRMDEHDKCVDAFMVYVERYPDDPKALNSFAWFCASKKVGMERALPYALKMVELSGRDPGLLDTLGELHYAMGEYDKAIEVGEEAWKKDPEDQYLAEQLEKYRNGKKEAKDQAKG